MARLADFLGSADTCTAQAAACLKDAFGVSPDTPAVHVYVPGRVEFLGKHTDYAGGRSLLLAVDKGFRLITTPRTDKKLRVAAQASAADVQEFEIGQTPAHAPGHWVNYVATVARRVKLNFADKVDLKGANIAFMSDLPPAAGMSSSSALMVAHFLGVSTLNKLDQTAAYQREIKNRLNLAEYLGCVENGQSFGQLTGEAGVGTFGGSEDHTAMLCCKADMLGQYSFAPGVFERDIPFPTDFAILIGSSGVQAVKTGAAKDQYNRLSIRSRKALAAFNRAAGTDFKRLREVALKVGPNGLMQGMELIQRGAGADEQDLALPERFEQFFREDQQIIPAVGDALAADKVAAIGKLIDASHANAARGLENVIPQTDFLQKSARKLGAPAASYFGAGFGGSDWAMVPRACVDAFLAAWKKMYLDKFPDQAASAEFFVTHPGRAAEVKA